MEIFLNKHFIQPSVSDYFYINQRFIYATIIE